MVRERRAQDGMHARWVVRGGLLSAAAALGVALLCLLCPSNNSCALCRTPARPERAASPLTGRLTAASWR